MPPTALLSTTPPHTSIPGTTFITSAARLAATGPNRLAEAKGPPYARIALRQFVDPLVGLLVAAAAVSFAIGERVEALAIAAIVVLNAVLVSVTFMTLLERKIIAWVQVRLGRDAARSMMGLLRDAAAWQWPRMLAIRWRGHPLLDSTGNVPPNRWPDWLTGLASRVWEADR